MEKFSEEIQADPRFRIGMRNIKTGLAVGICLIFFQAIGLSDGIQAAIASIICMKSSLQNSIQTGIERMVGTALGAFLGTMALLLIESTNLKIATILAIIGVISIIYLCNVLKIQASIVISLVVFLLILIGEKDTAPVIYGLMRLGETFFGIVVAYLINRFFDFRNIKNMIRNKDIASPSIRSGNLDDLATIMGIWLESNLSSHTRINSFYWHNNYDSVKKSIQEAGSVFVYEAKNNLLGFIVLTEEYDILALNAKKDGKDKKAKKNKDYKNVIEKLILHCQELYPCLTIKAFVSNEKLIETLVNLNFFIEKERVNSKANADEYVLTWSDKS